jgi:hypothetical protein
MKNQTTNTNDAVVATYDNHGCVEKAIKKLTDAKIPVNKLSVIGKGYHRDDKIVGFYNAGDCVKFWGMLGTFWGGMWESLAGGLYMTVPAMGQVMVLGQFAATVMAAVEEAVTTGDSTALNASFLSIGIPKDSILQYEEALKADGFLLLVQGTNEDVERARALLKETKAKQVDKHCCQDNDKNAPAPLKVKAAR